MIAEVAANGLADRSLRELAAAVGTSHRMLLYHFGSREGLTAAVVEATEAAQRELLRELAAEVDGPAELIRALWTRVSSPELRPFVRLFFESLAAPPNWAREHPRIGAQERPVRRGDTDVLTSPWIDDSLVAAAELGIATDPAEIRLGIAVVRGLLIDVLATGDVEAATAALERYIAMWEGSVARGS